MSTEVYELSNSDAIIYYTHQLSYVKTEKLKAEMRFILDILESDPTITATITEYDEH